VQNLARKKKIQSINPNKKNSKNNPSKQIFGNGKREKGERGKGKKGQ